MRFNDQHVWNFLFLIFFIGMIAFGGYALERFGYRSLYSINLFELLLISLASFRLIRLVVYDKIFAFFREQFFDEVTIDGVMTLVKPKSGPRRTLADLLSCPWCFGIWSAATVTFFYFLTPYAFFPVLFMAIAAIATLLQLFANMTGWKAENYKRATESTYTDERTKGSSSGTCG